MHISKSYYKELFSIITISVILASILAVNIRPVLGVDPVISVDPASSTVKVGDQFSVNINLDYAQNLYGYEVWMSFDNSKLNATAIDYMNYLNTPTNLWSQQVNANNVTLAISSVYPAAAKTGGSPPPLARVNFTCIGIGVSSLHLYNTLLADNLAKPITHTTSDGQVNCTVSTAYDDVIFDSSFEMGNLINVTFQEGNAGGYRYYTAELNYSTATFPDKHWWFYFSMANVTGKTVKVELKNLAEPDFTGLPSPGLPRWPDVEPVYSYNDADWLRVPDGNYSCGTNVTRNFNITLSPTQDKVWLAPIPPYTVSMRDNLLSSYASSPYLSVSSLGTTPLGQSLKVATITDPGYSDSGKFRIYTIAQQHSGETIASFVTEGMIRFLLNATDPTAATIRRNYIFRFIPIFNVEGVYYGISRYTPFRGAAQYDLNRAWANNPISTVTVPEVNWTFMDVQSWMPDAFLDMHTEINGESSSQTSIDCFFLHDGLYDAAMVNFCNNVSRGFDGTKDYWPETAPRSATGSQMAATNMRTRLGVHPAVDMEHPHDDLRNSTAHPVDHNPMTIADWTAWGRKIVLGIHDYYGPYGAVNLVTDTVEVINNGCTVYASDTYWDGSPYYEPVNVTISNSGTTASGSFNVSLSTYSYNISLQEDYFELRVTGLNPGENTTLVFNWRPLHTGLYNLTTTVDCHNEIAESSETDNTFIIIEYPVALIGDVNGDHTVGIVDAVIVSLAWASSPGGPTWNIRADLNHDGTVGIGDGVRIGLNWAKTW